MRFLVSVCVALLLVGCATTQPQLTRDEWKKITTREYASVTADEVLNAAEKVFRLADGDDFVVAHQDRSMVASRRWTVYLVLSAAMGTDYWRVDTVDADGKMRASAFVSTDMGLIAPMPTTQAGTYSAGSTPMAGSPVQGTAIYDVFWSRMDWMLGKRKDWMSCKEADALVKQKVVWGVNEALCNSFNIKDQSPVESDRIIAFK